MGKGVVMEEDDAEIFKINQFNLLASDSIAVNRTLPDVRPPRFVDILLYPCYPCLYH